MKQLKIQHFRNHTTWSSKIKPGVTLISGLNGSGKTSIIEAIFLALQGKSWRSNWQDILQTGQSWWRIDLELDKETRTVKYQNQHKGWQVGYKTSKTLSRAKKVQVVLFEPEDTRIFYGSPKRRRDFVDRFIAQTNPDYQTILSKYQRILLQRNAALKNPAVTSKDLLVWDLGLAELGAKMVAERQAWVAEINQEISQNYQAIRQSQDQITVVYRNRDTASKLREKLQASFAKEKFLGHTTVGPHKDDLVFLINQKPAQQTVSRGEAKLILLTIFTILIKKHQIKYVLFDDLFNEIDTEKIKEFNKVLKGIPFVLITDCRDLPQIKFDNLIKL